MSNFQLSIFNQFKIFKIKKNENLFQIKNSKFQIYSMTYDTIIIGGGPAGVAAGVYAARKKIKTLLITDAFGGQSIVSLDIQNFIGIPSISGFDLAQAMEQQLRAHKEVEILLGDRVAGITKQEGGGFAITTEGGKSFETKTILVTAGSTRRKLNIPGEKEFDGRGVAYCATCDAPLFRGKRVAVVGGGNAALEGVRDLLGYAEEIYLFVREKIKADPTTTEKISTNPKVKIFLGTELTKISGTESVEHITYKIRATGEEKEMPAEGVFIEIGWSANSSIVNGLVTVNSANEIVINHQTQETSCTGIWAAGDVTDTLYKQNNTSMGDAVKAVLNINNFLHK